MLENPLFADEIFGFHVQQAVEKLLKAWLCVCSGTYPMTHELARLLALLESQGMKVEAYWPLVQYTIFAVQARYEEGITELDEPINRVTEIQNVRALLTQVEQAIAAQG